MRCSSGLHVICRLCSWVQRQSRDTSRVNYAVFSPLGPNHTRHKACFGTMPWKSSRQLSWKLLTQRTSYMTLQGCRKTRFVVFQLRCLAAIFEISTPLSIDPIWQRMRKFSKRADMSTFTRFFFLKSRLQSHFVAVNCGVYWWWEQHTLPTWGFGFAMCLVHQVLPTARGAPGWSPIQVHTESFKKGMVIRLSQQSGDGCLTCFWRIAKMVFGSHSFHALLDRPFA